MVKKKIVTLKEFEKIIIDLKNIEPNKKPKIINLGGNLFLYPRKSDSKIKFAVRLINGKSDKKIIIGHYPNTSLAEARLKAKDAMKEAQKFFVNEVDKESYLIPTFAQFFNT